MMRAATRELHYHRATVSPIGIAPVVDQFPAHPISIRVRDHCSRDSRHYPTGRTGLLCGQTPSNRQGAFAERDPGHQFQGLLPHQSGGEADHCFLSFAAHNEINGRLLLHDLRPVVGRVHAAINYPDMRQRRAHGPGDPGGSRVARGGARVSQQYPRQVREPESPKQWSPLSWARTRRPAARPGVQHRAKGHPGPVTQGAADVPAVCGCQWQGAAG